MPTGHSTPAGAPEPGQYNPGPHTRPVVEVVFTGQYRPAVAGVHPSSRRAPVSSNRRPAAGAAIRADCDEFRADCGAATGAVDLCTTAAGAEAFGASNAGATVFDVIGTVDFRAASFGGREWLIAAAAPDAKDAAAALAADSSDPMAPAAPPSAARASPSSPKRRPPCAASGAKPSTATRRDPSPRFDSRGWPPAPGARATGWSSDVALPNAPGP